MLNPETPQSAILVLYKSKDFDVAREQIDQEIQDLEDSVRQLKSRRNRLAPISRLPNEILYKIFTTFACLEQSDHVDGTDISWIRPITAVCSHWRAVALECPRLWSTIVFSRPSWAAEMLKRSKMAPLIINADLTYLTPKMVDAVHMALQHVTRIRELRLTASKATMEKLIDNLSERAPMLRSLCLSNPRYSHFLLDDGYTLPDTLFGNGHHLERLELVKCNIKWDSPLLNGLVHLKIHKTSTLTRPTISQLLGALSKMPHLETLDMDDSLPFLSQDGGSTMEDPSIIVSLPHLSQLRLSSTTLEVSYLLRHVTYPTTTSLRLICRADPTTDYDFSCLFNAISSVGSGTDGSTPIQSLVIQDAAPKGIQFSAWTSVGVTDEYSTSPLIKLHLSWLSHGENRAEAIMVDICNHLLLAKLRTLSVYHLAQVAKKSWLDAFGGLLSIRTINVRGPAAYGLVLALSEEIEMKPKENGTPRANNQIPGVFLPNLRKLWIEDTDFGDEFRAEGFFDDLLDCLIDRYERKAEIRELHLVECSRISEVEVGLLHEVVVDVEWDGIEQSPEDEDDDESGGSYESVGWGFPFYASDVEDFDSDSFLGYDPF